MPRYIKTIAPVDSLSGKFGKRESNICGKTIIANVRKAATNSNGGNPFMYFSVLTKTTYAGTRDQEAWNTKFGEICSAARARLRNPEFISADAVAFRSQTQYKSIYSFVWNLVRDQMQA